MNAFDWILLAYSLAVFVIGAFASRPVKKFEVAMPLQGAHDDLCQSPREEGVMSE